jgi:hypothetical protein
MTTITNIFFIRDYDACFPPSIVSCFSFFTIELSICIIKENILLRVTLVFLYYPLAMTPMPTKYCNYSL